MPGDFFTSFLSVELCLSVNCQHKLRSPAFGFWRTCPFRQECRVPSRGTRHSTAQRSDLQVLMHQHGDFFAHPTVAAPSVPRERFAADEELRDLHACNVTESGELFLMLSSIPLSERTCVRDLFVATDLSVPDPMSQYLESFLRQLLSLNRLTKMILSSFQNHHGSTQNCVRSCHRTARWSYDLQEKLVCHADYCNF